MSPCGSQFEHLRASPSYGDRWGIALRASVGRLPRCGRFTHRSARSPRLAGDASVTGHGAGCARPGWRDAPRERSSRRSAAPRRHVRSSICRGRAGRSRRSRLADGGSRDTTPLATTASSTKRQSVTTSKAGWLHRLGDQGMGHLVVPREAAAGTRDCGPAQVPVASGASILVPSANTTISGSNVTFILLSGVTASLVSLSSNWLMSFP
jgi:hypothetical protein